MLRQPQIFTVTIMKDENGIYLRKQMGDREVRRIRAVRGDRIVWRCGFGTRFAVHFGWGSPIQFEKSHLCADADSKDVLESSVSEQAAFGEYKYSLAVWDGEKRRLWTDDPRVIVDKEGDR